MQEQGKGTPFPGQLLSWAGNRSGGVRRLFDESSGRPGGTAFFRTNLLARLEEWAGAIGGDVPATPRVVLLVGGPGNGKTEAIERTMGWLDGALGCRGRLLERLALEFRPDEGKVPRLVRVNAGQLCDGRQGELSLSIVQDASVVAGSTGHTAADLLIEELSEAASAGDNGIYLCCVNRGVLDDALIAAAERGLVEDRLLLETVTRSVSLLPEAPSCWPLEGYPGIAIWPMDMESLLAGTARGDPAPAQQIVRHAVDQSMWPPVGSCAAGPRCPFCTSREQLSQAREANALLAILRWFELGSGKRWSFRDLFSVLSYLLAGHRDDASTVEFSPCEWAARLMVADAQAVRNDRPSRISSPAIFQLVAAQYQHALFHHWDRDAGPALLRDLKELGLQDNNTAMGLQYFLASRRSPYLPAMIEGALDGLSAMLDPALASPDTTIEVSRSTSYVLRDIDLLFSRSVAEGLDHIRRSRILSPLEIELLGRLGELDSHLSRQDVRRKRPATATRVQRLVRDFACRLARRSIGARTAAVLDAPVFADFQGIVDDPGQDAVDEVAREIENLLNKDQYFEVSLTTTFGQPLPPANGRATLVVQRRDVQPAQASNEGRPAAPLRFLEVGEGSSAQAVALTYDLFKAIREIERGMSVASLPRSVLALLDTTGARLAGPIVRDSAALRRALIQLGNGMVVQERRGTFAVVREEPRL